MAAGEHSQLCRLSGSNSLESVCNKILKHLKLQQLNKPVSFCVLNMYQTSEDKVKISHCSLLDIFCSFNENQCI